MKSILILSLTASMFINVASAQSVSVLGLTKTRHHDQTTVGTTTLHEYSMQGFLEGESLSGSFPSSSNRFTRTGGGPYALIYEDGFWEYKVFFPSKTLLDAEFPNTTYNFLVGTSPAVVLPFGADSYPVQPVIAPPPGRGVAAGCSSAQPPPRLASRSPATYRMATAPSLWRCIPTSKTSYMRLLPPIRGSTSLSLAPCRPAAWI